jgi:hypothetical protein
MFIIDNLLVKAPLKGVVRLARFLEDQALDRMYDPQTLREELMQLQTQFEMDEISEEEYDEREAEILQRMQEAQKNPRH